MERRGSLAGAAGAPEGDEEPEEAAESETQEAMVDAESGVNAGGFGWAPGPEWPPVQARGRGSGSGRLFSC